MSHYLEYVKNRNFDLTKTELITNTPLIKTIEGVKIVLNTNEDTIKIIFKKRSFFLAFSILTLELADFSQYGYESVDGIYLNNTKLQISD